MTAVGLIVAGFAAGIVVAMVVALLMHERREFARMDAKERAALERDAARELRERERHETLIKLLEDNRRIYLAERSDVLRRLDDHETRITRIESRKTTHREEAAT